MEGASMGDWTRFITSLNKGVVESASSFREPSDRTGDVVEDESTRWRDDDDGVEGALKRVPCLVDDFGPMVS